MKEKFIKDDLIFVLDVINKNKNGMIFLFDLKEHSAKIIYYP